MDATQTNENKVVEVQPSITFGERDSTWAAYDTYTAPVLFKDISGEDKETQYKAIFKSNRLVSIMSKRYQLLPNEKALQMADEIAEKIGFKQHKVYYSKNENYMNATYLNTSDKSYSVNVNDNTYESSAGEAKASLRDSSVGTEASGRENYTIDHRWEHKEDIVYFGFSILYHCEPL